jgi:hypothetical protein
MDTQIAMAKTEPTAAKSPRVSAARNKVITQ